jgi:hypothetical protein
VIDVQENIPQPNISDLGGYIPRKRLRTLFVFHTLLLFTEQEDQL